MQDQKILDLIIEKINNKTKEQINADFNIYIPELPYGSILDQNDINYIMTGLHRLYHVNCIRISDHLVASKKEYTQNDRWTEDMTADKQIYILILKNLYTALRGNTKDTREFSWSKLYHSGKIPDYIKDKIIENLINHGIKFKYTNYFDHYNERDDFILSGLTKFYIDKNAEIPYPEFWEDSNYVFITPKTS